MELLIELVISAGCTCMIYEAVDSISGKQEQVPSYDEFKNQSKQDKKSKHKEKAKEDSGEKTETGVEGEKDNGEYVAPQGGGGITSQIKVNGKTVNFGHGGRHLKGTGLSIDTVNEALAEEVSTSDLAVGQFYKGQIVIEGFLIEYTSYGVTEEVINVGTYYPIY